MVNEERCKCGAKYVDTIPLGRRHACGTVIWDGGKHESSDCLRRQLQQAEAAVGAMRDVLESVEWAGFIRTEDMFCCPVCREPEEVYNHDQKAWIQGSHAPDCKLGAALASPGGRSVLQRMEALEAALQDLFDAEPCRYDHHGYCQTHFWTQTDPPCPHARTKELLGVAQEGADDA